MMDRFSKRHSSLALAVLALAVGLAPSQLRAKVQPAAQRAANSAGALNWQSPAQLKHLITKTSGTLVINDQGVEFQPRKESPLRWSYVEIQSFHLRSHRLDLKTYQNRNWHLHGDRTFHFTLENALSPEVATKLAQRVQKPVKDGIPNPHTPAFAILPARHRTLSGGSNGVLRFRKGGIDYVTPNNRGARSWRWSDIETIANPDPYHFRIQGYRETFEFELKKPMSRKLFNELWDDVYGRGLAGLAYSEGRRQ